MTHSAELEDAWLSVGAPEKASSVAKLTEGLGISSVLEVGCGTGAVMAEMVNRKVGVEYAACEPSTELSGYARSRTYDAEVEIRGTTFEGSGFDARRWDLIVLSHVLEHTDEPAALLAAVLATARHVVIEIPLEGTRLSRFRSVIRERLTGRPRTDNAAGHVQFFSEADVHRLAGWCGGKVMRTRAYFPAATFRHMGGDAKGWRRLYYAGLLLSNRVLGSSMLARLYYGHFAALIVPRALGQEAARHPLFWRPPQQ
jgi:SAM-dependent methyltransferase